MYRKIKKGFFTFLLAAGVVALVGCGGSTDAPETEEQISVSADEIDSKQDAVEETDMETESVPEETTVQEDGWRCFRIAGVLDFSLVGILAGLSGILAEARVGIFAVSTYDTDYILVKQTELRRAQEALEKRGYSFVTL